jgi:predicted peptidase
MATLVSYLAHVFYCISGLFQCVIRTNSKSLFSASSRFFPVVERACIFLSIMAAAILFNFQEKNAIAAVDLNKGISGNFVDGLGNTMPYWFFLPDGYVSGQSYPLVTFLHGSGDGGNSTRWHIDTLFNATQGVYGSEYKSFLLVPQVQLPPYNYNWTSSVSENMAIQLIDQIISSYNVDSNRLYLTGLSMGGFGTWDYIADYPKKFAAAIPLSGGGNPSTAPIIKDIPIWAFHGAADTNVYPSQTDNMYYAIQNAGVTIEYTRPAGVGHNGAAWLTFYDGSTYQNSKGQHLYEWMFAQTVPEPSSLIMALCAISAGLLYWIRTLVSWLWRPVIRTENNR